MIYAKGDLGLLWADHRQLQIALLWTKPTHWTHNCAHQRSIWCPWKKVYLRKNINIQKRKDATDQQQGRCDTWVEARGKIKEMSGYKGQHIRRGMQKKREVKEKKVRQQGNSLLSKAGEAALAVRSKHRLKQGLEQRLLRRTIPKTYLSRL